MYFYHCVSLIYKIHSFIILGVYDFSLTFNKYHVEKSPFKVIIREEDEQRLKQNQTNKQVFGQSSTDNSDSSDYEINNWNTKFNTTLNRIMEETILDTEVESRVLTPITDTSEEDSSGESKFKKREYNMKE